MRRQALKLCVVDTNFRRIARHLGVNPQTVVNWVDAAAANLPAPPSPQERRQEQAVDTLEMDQLFTFIGQKKPAYILTCVERTMRCILRFGVGSERDWNSLQSLVTDARPAHAYFSGGLLTYAHVMYLTGSAYTQMNDKSQTYSVEGTTPSCVIIRRAWAGRAAAFRAACRRCPVPLHCLCMPGTAGNTSNGSTLSCLPISGSSLSIYYRQSLNTRLLDKPAQA